MPHSPESPEVIRALRESEERLRAFAELAADWFWESDADGVITYVSDVHRQITGIPDQRIIGLTREQLFDRGIYRASNPAVHLRTLRNHWDSMIEYSVTRDDGHEVIVHDRAAPFFDGEGKFQGYRGVGRDITEQRQLTERIAYQAAHDPLTGSLNRREFERRLDEAVEEARMHDNEHVLCFVDLDRFKLLNDTLGHAAGDHLLKLIVDRIRNTLSMEDLLARIGGDEFGLILRNTGIRRAERLMRALSTAIRAHEFEWQERHFGVALSVGLAPVSRDTPSSSALLARADAACYRAKDADGGVWVSDEREGARLSIYTGILRSLASGPVELSDNFQLAAQPIHRLAGVGDPQWYEVLLRLTGDDGCFYRPFEFIRLAEQYGKMPVIDQWVLETALGAHTRMVEQAPDAVMSINLSGVPDDPGRHVEKLEHMLRQHRLRPGNLCIEISERAAINDLDGATALVRALTRLGCYTALDDFGSGAASFSCLRALPVHYIKLSGELVRKLRPQDTDIVIVDSINRLARRLGITAVAVQVESDQAIEALRETGIELGQGDALAATRPLERLIDAARGG